MELNKMDIQPLLAYNTWLSLPVDTRVKLKTLFNIPRTGEVIVRTGEMTAQGNIGSVTTQDGHSAKDLYAITVEKMQEVLGTKETDFYVLFNEVVTNIDAVIAGETASVPTAMTDIGTKTLDNDSKKMLDNGFTIKTPKKSSKKSSKKTTKKHKDGKKKK